MTFIMVTGRDQDHILVSHCCCEAPFMLEAVLGHGVLTVKVTMHRLYCTKGRLN